jgi:hypothetical protein
MLNYPTKEDQLMLKYPTMEEDKPMLYCYTYNRKKLGSNLDTSASRQASNPVEEFLPMMGSPQPLVSSTWFS